MGLDIVCSDPECTHPQLFHGSYSTFHYFRRSIVSAAGYRLPKEDTMMFDTELERMREKDPILLAFLLHSDCKGQWTIDECTALIAVLQVILPKLDPNEGVRPQVWKNDGSGNIQHKFLPVSRTWFEIGTALVDGLQHCVTCKHEAVFC
jgi:hypothetical protein